MLHVALARYIDDQQNFSNYKEVIKEILQFGAKRQLQNQDKLTPIELLEGYKEKIKLQTPQNYLDEDVSYDENNGAEIQYEKFRFYLGYNSRENAFCCPKHAPLEKVRRSCKMMIGFLLLNFGIISSSMFFFYYIFTLDERKHIDVDWHDKVWLILMSSSGGIFFLSLSFFMLVCCK